MQPDNKQGFYQPGADPNAAGTPVQPPVANQPLQPIDPAAMQQALDEAGPVAPTAATAPLADDEQYDDEYDDEDQLSEPVVTWVAHEYIHHEKGTTWFVLFAVIVAALMALSIFVMNSWSFAAVLIAVVAVVIVYSRRPPRELTYSLSDDGLMIDNKLYEFEEFKSFGVVRDGDQFSVMLIPVQRFQPGITVYFPEESGEAIVDTLGSRLPMKDLKLDVVDHIVRFLRL